MWEVVVSTVRLNQAAVFFFSGRGRHTRSLRDWSSDVCSSDLDVLIIERENILARSDHKRARVYISFGREFTLDIPNQQFRYVDTGEKEPLVVELVEPGTGAKIGRASCR